MSRLLCALVAGLFASAPAYADDDDKPYKDYYKRLREQQKKQAEYYREQQKKYEEWQREDRKRREEFHREQRKRQEEMFRDHQWQPYPAPGGWSPYGAPGNGGYHTQPFAPMSPYLQPGAGNPYVQPFAPSFPFPGYPGSVVPNQNYLAPYFAPPPVWSWRGDGDDD